MDKRPEMKYIDGANGVAAPAPRITYTYDNVGDTQGFIERSGAVTDDNTVVLRGINGGVAGSTIKIMDGDREVGTVIVKPDGSWEASIVLADGLNHLVAVGSTGAPSRPFDLIYEPVPKITYTYDNVGGEQGIVECSGVVTDDNILVLRGINGGAAGSIITIMDGDRAVGTATVKSDGSWEANIVLVDGLNHLVAVGAHGTVSAPFDIAYEPVPKISYTYDNVGNEQGFIDQSGAVTDDNTLVLRGINGGAAGSIITIMDDDRVVGTATVKADGSWEASIALADGLNQLVAVGSYGTESTTFYITYENAASPLTITSFIDDVGSQSGLVEGGGKTTDDEYIELKGINGGPNGSVIHIVNGDGQQLGYGIVRDDGSWTVFIELTDGLNLLVATSSAAPQLPSTPFEITYEASVVPSSVMEFTMPILESEPGQIGPLSLSDVLSADSDDLFAAEQNADSINFLKNSKSAIENAATDCVNPTPSDVFSVNTLLPLDHVQNL